MTREKIIQELMRARFAAVLLDRDGNVMERNRLFLRLYASEEERDLFFRNHREDVRSYEYFTARIGEVCVFVTSEKKRCDGKTVYLVGVFENLFVHYYKMSRALLSPCEKLTAKTKDGELTKEEMIQNVGDFLHRFGDERRFYRALTVPVPEGAAAACSLKGFFAALEKAVPPEEAQILVDPFEEKSVYLHASQLSCAVFGILCSIHRIGSAVRIAVLEKRAEGRTKVQLEFSFEDPEAVFSLLCAFEEKGKKKEREKMLCLSSLCEVIELALQANIDVAVRHASARSRVILTMDEAESLPAFFLMGDRRKNAFTMKRQLRERFFF